MVQGIGWPSQGPKHGQYQTLLRTHKPSDGNHQLAMRAESCAFCSHQPQRNGRVFLTLWVSSHKYQPIYNSTLHRFGHKNR